MSRKTNSDRNEVEAKLEQNFIRPTFSFKGREFKFTDKQKEILDCVFDYQNRISIIDGPAGTGKSLLSVYAALHEFKAGKFDDILYLRTAVESSSRSLGFLKGDLDEKFSVYRQILNDKVSELVKDKDQNQLLTSSSLEALPINYIRGASWRNKFVILDEHQNATIDEMKTLMTRIGKGSKLILCGDMQQADIKNSGIQFIKQIFDTPECVEMGIDFFQLTSDDIVRSEIVKFIVKKFEDFVERENDYRRRTKNTQPAYSSFPTTSYA